MTSSSSSSTSGGIGFSGALTILFVGLKLTGHISWPWLWVLAPAWIPLAIGLLCLIGLGVIAGLEALRKRSHPNNATDSASD
jgi:hypothetical protein